MTLVGRPAAPTGLSTTNATNGNTEDGKINGCYLRVEDVTEEEMSIRDRDERIGQISREAYKDPLTSVGSKAAYVRKMNEINESIINGSAEFAIVMLDT